MINYDSKIKKYKDKKNTSFFAKKKKSSKLKFSFSLSKRKYLKFKFNIQIINNLSQINLN